jgi:hypothetical protein
MATLAITDNLNLCKNNYYYALTSESAQNPPPKNILPSHTGIADSGATDFYFAPDAPVTNYNPQAPIVGVRVANGQPERSVASATLSLVPSLPQAAMTGHVMPAFPHTLIGLGPFADLNCKIVFTKTAVTVYHPDGHTLLSGWRDDTGPRRWHFPLTAEAARRALDTESPQPPIPITAEAAHVAGDTASHPDAPAAYAHAPMRTSTHPTAQPAPPPPPRAPPAVVGRTPRKRKWRKRRPRSSKQHRQASPRRRVTFTLPPQHVDKDSTIWRRVHPDGHTSYRSVPLPVQLAAPIDALHPGQPHPCQGILATSATGAACSVYYLYGAAQAVALAARASSAPFDPRSLDLPSIGALVGFYHACLGFPVKQTWLDAIKAGNCDTFEGLTYSNAAKYCPDADETIMGHMAQQRQNVRSTKPKQPPPVPLVVRPPSVPTASNQVFIVTQPLSKLFTDDTGRFLSGLGQVTNM